MTLSGADTRVRHLINQTDSANTLFDSTNFIANVLNQGRRMFASILPEEMIPKLRKSVALSVVAEVGAYPADFLRTVKDPYITCSDGADTFIPVRISEHERWRMKFLEINTTLLSGYYYYERSDGVVIISSATTIDAITYEYIKTPADLSGSDNVEMPADIDDLVIDFAFEKCMGTSRGNLELATFLAKNRGLTIGAKQ